MIAMKCDCCGKLYERYDGCGWKGMLPTGEKSNAIILANRKPNILFGEVSNHNKYLDLCPECMATIINVLAELGGTKKEEEEKEPENVSH